MVSARNIYLSFPINTLVSINFTISSSIYYTLYFPQITSDNQLGAELNLLLANGITTTNTINTVNQLYITIQGTNKFFLSNTITSTSTNYTTTNLYSKFIAIKTPSGQYGWFKYLNDTLYAPYINNYASTFSNDFTGLNTFNNYLPSSTVTPVSTTDLTTKNYVDTAISNNIVTKSGFTKQLYYKTNLTVSNNFSTGWYFTTLSIANSVNFNSTTSQASNTLTIACDFNSTYVRTPFSSTPLNDNFTYKISAVIVTSSLINFDFSFVKDNFTSFGTDNNFNFGFLITGT